MKKVFVARHLAEAHLVKGLLESEGIGAEVHGEDLASVRGAVPVTPDTSPSVWIIEESQAEEAAALIERYEAGTAAGLQGAPPWQCSMCGEKVEQQFTNCWKCGADRVDS